MIIQNLEENWREKLQYDIEYNDNDKYLYTIDAIDKDRC